MLHGPPSMWIPGLSLHLEHVANMAPRLAGWLAPPYLFPSTALLLPAMEPGKPQYSFPSLFGLRIAFLIKEDKMKPSTTSFPTFFRLECGQGAWIPGSHLRMRGNNHERKT